MSDLVKEEEVLVARQWLGTTEKMSDAEVAALIAGTFLHMRIKLRLAFLRLVETLNGTTHPIMFPQVNGMLRGNRTTKDLPVCRTVEGYTCSCWHIPLWKRIKLLWSCNVYLAVKGTTQPPLWIDTEVVWK